MKYRHDSFSIAELVQGVSNGWIALPEFQRPFVWEPTDVLDLLDSVANGWPIGSLLTLEGPQPFEIKKIDAGPEVQSRSVKHYLLDGQQRVTSLFHVLTQSSDVTYYVDLSEGTPDDPPDFRWVNKTRGIPGTSSPWTFPIGFLMDDRAFLKATSGLARSEISRLEATRRARLGSLLDPAYRIPTIAMAQDIELEALTRIFENLNRNGVHLNAFDLMVAVLYPHDFDLRKKWEEAPKDFPALDDSEIKGLEVLKVVALWRRDHDVISPPTRLSRRVTGVRQGDVLNTPAAYIITHWRRALSAYQDALMAFSSEGGIADAASVPSSAMLLTAADLLSPAGVVHEGGGLCWRQPLEEGQQLAGLTTQRHDQVLRRVELLPVSLASELAELVLMAFDAHASGIAGCADISPQRGEPAQWLRLSDSRRART